MCCTILTRQRVLMEQKRRQRHMQSGTHTYMYMRTHTHARTHTHTHTRTHIIVSTVSSLWVALHGLLLLNYIILSYTCIYYLKDIMQGSVCSLLCLHIRAFQVARILPWLHHPMLTFTHTNMRAHTHTHTQLVVMYFLLLCGGASHKQ